LGHLKRRYPTQGTGVHYPSSREVENNEKGKTPQRVSPAFKTKCLLKRKRGIQSNRYSAAQERGSKGRAGGKQKGNQ